MADLTIITTALPNAFVGESYRVRVQARRGTLPYRWTATGLPEGMTIDLDTGTLAETTAGILAPQVGVYTPTITVTDAVGATAQLTPSLTVRPANYRRRTTLMLDPTLQAQVERFPADSVTREEVTGHFAEGPRRNVRLGPGGAFEADVFSHWAGQIGFASGASDATIPESPSASPSSPTPASPSPSAGVSVGPAVISLYDVVRDLQDNAKVLAEPVVLTVTAYDSLESPTTPVQAIGFTASDVYLGDNLDVVLTEYTSGSAYDSPDFSIGYPALAQSITLPADAKVDALTVYGSRPATGQVGGVTVSISEIAGSPADTVAINTGVYASPLGSSPKVVAVGYISPSQFKTDASRAAWDETFAISVPLTVPNAVSPASPGVAASPIILSGSTDYYLVFQSDYFLSPSSPANYLRLAATVDSTVTNVIPGSTASVVTTGGALVSPLYATNEAASPAQTVTAVAYALDVLWNSATVGVVTIQSTDPFNSPTADKYWVGGSTTTAAQVRQQAFSLIDGYDRSGAGPVEDLTNWDEVVDAYGNQAQITQVNIVGGAEVNPSGGGQVDADGFLSTGGITLRVAWTPNSRGAVPPAPFKVVAGRRRTLGNLDADALIRTANKTGSTDAAILAQLSDAIPSNPLLSLAQIEPDAAGNVGLTVASGALGINKFSASSTVQLSFLATLVAEQLGGSSTSVQFDSLGALTLLAGDYLTVTPTANQIRLDADPGVATINSVAPDGSQNIQLTAGEDAAHAGQTFVTFSTGTNEVVVGTNIPDATTSQAGLHSTTDKERINALFSGAAAVSTSTTGGVSGGHSHTARFLTLDQDISGYLTLTSGMTIEDALFSINTALASQFTTASESGALSTLNETYIPAFQQSYLSDSSPTIVYASPGYKPGDLVTNLVAGTAGTTFSVVTTPFGDPGNAGTLSLELGTASPSPSTWTVLEQLDISLTYGNALTAIGGSPPNYSDVATHMGSNPVQPGGSPTTKIAFQAVDYLGLDNTSAPVFELRVSGNPVFTDFPAPLGFNRVRISHDTGSGVNRTNSIEIFKDQYTGAADPVINTAELSIDNGVAIRYVSGIPHVTASENWGLYVDADNLYNITYQQNLLTVADASDGTYSFDLQYYLTTYASPQDATWIPSPETVFLLGTPTDPYDTVQPMTALVASDGYTSRDLTINFNDVFVSDTDVVLNFSDPYGSPYGRLLHLGRAGASVGTTTVETFASEKYRIYPDTWGGTDLVSPVTSPIFTSFTTQPVAGDVLESGTYGWPSGAELTALGTESTWNVTDGSPSAEARSGKTFAVNPGTRTSRPAQVSDLGLVHPGYNTATEYDARTQMPALSSPFNVYGSYGSPSYDYYTDYSAQSSVVYYRLFTSGTAANQGRLRVYGYLRDASASPALTSYESYSSPLSSPDFVGSWYNVGPSASPVPTLSGISAEIKFVGDQSSVHADTPLGNPGKTGWLDMLTTGASSLYESGEDGYGAADTGGITIGAGYVDIYWRAGAFTTGNTSNQAVVRIALHGSIGLRTVITQLQMLNQSTDTPWSSGA